MVLELADSYVLIYIWKDTKDNIYTSVRNFICRVRAQCDTLVPGHYVSVPTLNTNVTVLFYRTPSRILALSYLKRAKTDVCYILSRCRNLCKAGCWFYVQVWMLYGTCICYLLSTLISTPAHSAMDVQSPNLEILSFYSKESFYHNHWYWTRNEEMS